MTTDVVIVGGGVIGLSIAYRLAREGASAAVFDRGDVGREASWAGAGLIAANTTRVRTQPSADLRSWSAELWPEWSRALLVETGLDNGYRRTGGVDVAANEREEHELRSMAGRWKLEGVVHERLQPSDFGRVEPALNPELRLAYFLPDRAQVRNPWHLRALAVAATRRGIVFKPREGVTSFESDGDRVTAVVTAQGKYPCGKVVMAAGAWTGPLLGQIGVSAPTPPLRGQIVLLKSSPPLLNRIVEHGNHYLVPREDGLVLIGSTEEDAGYESQTTTEGIRGLIDEALRLCPALAASDVQKAWAGLRPGSLDTRPYIGPAPGFSNVFVAAGHKRAGLQLSTGTAEAVSDLILDRPPRIDLAAFRIGREAAKESDADLAFRS